MSSDNAVALVGMSNKGVNLQSMSDAEKFCEKIAGTDIAPKGMKPEAIFGVIQAGAELGLSPLRALANMQIINGRVGPMGALAKALVRQADVLRPGTGFKIWFEGTPGEDDWTANIKTHRHDESDPTTTQFSVKDARRAGLWGKDGPWKKYPKRMLMWRAVGFHLDDEFGEVLMGFHIAEVLEDYPDAREPTVMEPVEKPARDPLLDDLEATAKTMQPMLVDGEPVDPETGEFETLVKETVADSKGILDALEEGDKSPMSEEEAAADLIREGLITEPDEDLAEPDPNNSKVEGEGDDLLF